MLPLAHRIRWHAEGLRLSNPIERRKMPGDTPLAAGRLGGLTNAEAAARLRQQGPNSLPSRKARPAWRQLAAQMVHFFALMLWVAGALAILAGMPQLGLAIFAVILLNGTFAFVQEYRAEQASEKLRDLLPRRATVIREGNYLEIDASELVTGDVITLQAGDRVSADIRLFETFSLSIDASTLTGESVPRTAQAGEIVFAGTFVVEGEGVGLVIATGTGTRLAGVARITEAGRRPRTPLAQELDRVVRILSIAALGAGVVFLVIAALVGIHLTDAFLFALGVVVAVVPEGLLPTVTLSLAWGAQRMAEHKALVRRLEAVETLGSTTFICTDKTGTLTLNEMSVVEVWTPRGLNRIEARGYDPETPIRAEAGERPALRDLVLSISYCSNGNVVQRDNRWVPQGNPLEAALAVFCRRMGIDPQRERSVNETNFVFPFDPRRRRMSAVAAGRLHVKGAPDAVLPLCVNTHGADSTLQQMATRGLRVIAVARRPIGSIDSSVRAEAIEQDLELLGLLGIEDPPRPEAAQSVAACRKAGIKVAMVTGDHPATARAIATEVGLLTEGSLVIEGRDLPSSDALLGALVDQDGIVLSRVSPEEKLRIARALRARGHVVAMTGDGVNDGPALQEASIGIAMGKAGTDVAREAADLVLLDDNFATIVAAVRQGRATFANIRRFLTYHLTDNVAELTPFVVWALSGGRFPLALGVLQVLSLDLGTDILPALALGTEPPSARWLERPPGALGTRGHLLDRSILVRAFGLLGPVEALGEMLAFLASMIGFGWRPGTSFPTGSPLLAASGAAFSAVVLGQMANAFACRSATRWPGALGWFTNRFLIYAVAAELALLFVFLYFGPLARILGHAPPTAIGASVAAVAFPAVLLADVIYKCARRRV
jgi:magnesium-transporting ATPase (P-type)